MLTQAEFATSQGERHWREIPAEEQVQLLRRYGEYLDALPRTCDMRTKERRFAAWLAQYRIIYPIF